MPAGSEDGHYFWFSLRPAAVGGFLNTRERPEFMHKRRPGIKKSIKASWRNRPFVFGLMLFLFNGVTMSIIQVILAVLC